MNISDSVRALIYPFFSNVDEVLISTPFKVSATQAFALNFQHFYVTRFEQAGGLIEVKVEGGEWSPVDANAITLFNTDGSVLTQGYGGAIGSDAGTLVDAQAAFSGLNQTDDELNNSEPTPKKVSVNLGDAYAGQQIQIRFRFVSAQMQMEGEADELWGLDEITLSGVNGTAFSKPLLPIQNLV